MNHSLHIRRTFWYSWLVFIFLFQSCSIFGPVGHGISQGYENSVSYFNGYYNARSLFSDAEAEIRLDASKKRGQPSSTATPDQIPASAKEKLLKVIDKCSNILTFHTSSTFVDDALLLIGKSFFYQAEYLKAERKFAELIAQYPNSSLVLETQVWYASTEEKLMRTEQGIRVCESVISLAKASGEDDLEVQAHDILSRLYLQNKQRDEAVAELEIEISLTSNQNIKAEAQKSLGDIYFSNAQYEKAATTYLQVGAYTSDIYLNFYSKLQAAIAYREIKEYAPGLKLVDAMIDNFRYKDFLPDLLFERANNYAVSGRRNDAIDEYIIIDTTYTKSEFSLRSDFQLGQLYEKELGDYRSAMKYYAKVNSAGSPKSVAGGRLKYATFKNYFETRRKLEMADSLLADLADTTRRVKIDTLAKNNSDTTKTSVMPGMSRLNPEAAGAPPLVSDTMRLKAEAVAQRISSRTDSARVLRAILDSLQNRIAQDSSRSRRSGSDSLKILKSMADSIRHRLSEITPVQKNRLSADSLLVLKSVAAQELGDIFYLEIIVPDSAFYWYNKSIEWDYHPIRSPRILYILAELSGMNPERKFPPSEEYYKRLDHDFPGSTYAEEARRFLGRVNTQKKADAAAIYFEQAERQIDSKEYRNAMETLRTITQFYPGSPFAAKSEYAIGWIFEHSLALPDSARVHYSSVTRNYSGTKYAVAAANRTLNEIQSETAKGDSARNQSTKIDTVKPRGRSLDSLTVSGAKTDTAKINTLTVDTSKVASKKIQPLKNQPMKADTAGMKNALVDSSNTKRMRVRQ
jgi:cellulose synthase operon protein C